MHGGATGPHLRGASLHDAAGYGVAGILVVDYRRADPALLGVRRGRAECSRRRDMRVCGNAVVVTALGGHYDGECGLKRERDAVVADVESHRLIGLSICLALGTRPHFYRQKCG